MSWGICHRCVSPSTIRRLPALYSSESPLPPRKASFSHRARRGRQAAASAIGARPAFTCVCNPVDYLVVPRVLTCVLALLVLTGAGLRAEDSGTRSGARRAHGLANGALGADGGCGLSELLEAGGGVREFEIPPRRRGEARASARWSGRRGRD